MEHDNDQPARDAQGFRHDEGRTEKPQFGIARSIRPGVTVPATVLVVVMTDGSYLLVGYPQREPAAFIAVDDADPMRKVLTTAFGRPEDTPANDNNRRLRVAPDLL